MSRLFRGFFIVWVVLRYGLDELVLSSFERPAIRLLTRIVSIGRNLDAPRGVRLREALERLIAIATRRDDDLRAALGDPLGHRGEGVAPLVGELQEPIVRNSQKPIALPASHGLGNCGAGVIQSFGNPSAHGV